MAPSLEGVGRHWAGEDMKTGATVQVSLQQLLVCLLGKAKGTQ